MLDRAAVTAKSAFPLSATCWALALFSRCVWMPAKAEVASEGTHTAKQLGIDCEGHAVPPIVVKLPARGPPDDDDFRLVARHHEMGGEQ